MRAAAIGVLCSGALFVACLIDRPSEGLTCSSNDDCASLDGNRQCQSGYCVIPNCPDDCTSCDEGKRTCQVECTSADDCDGTITCPSGWTCSVSCNAAGACDNVSCQDNSRCTVSCNAPGACNAISCSNACQCDVSCPSGNCASTSCPVRGNGANQVRCTQDGTVDTPCDSAHAASCASC